MSDDLAASLKQLLTDVLREVLGELVKNWKFPAAPPIRCTATSDELLLSPRETAKRLAISERHLFRLTRDGQIPSVRVGHCVRYSLEAIQAWVRDSEVTESRANFAEPKAKPVASASRLRKPRPPALKSKVPSQRKVPSQSKAPSRSKVRDNSPSAAGTGVETTPLARLMREVGIDRSTLPPVTNGELMRIAEVDMMTMHGWQHLHWPLPEEAANKLKEHFRRAVTQQEGDGQGH